MMWCILALSIVALATTIERTLFFARASTDPEKLETALGEALAVRDEARIRTLLCGNSSQQRLFRAAYTHWTLGRKDMGALLEQQLRRELYKWEKNLSVLDTIAKTAPLLGLLGTVVGMVQMFQTLNLGGAVSAAAVTGGIWKALFTTVAGLSVAIPAIIVHGILSAKIDSQEETLQRGVDFIVRKHRTSASALSDDER